MKTYKFSENEVKRRKRYIVTILIYMAIFSAVFIFYCLPLPPSFSFLLKLVVYIFTIVLGGMTMLLTLYIIIKQFRRMLLKIDDGVIIRLNGNSEEKIIINDITRVQSIENKNEEVICLKIFTGSRAAVLCGFESMNEIRDYISKNSSAKFEQKIRKIDFSDPKIMVPYLFIIGLIIIAVTNFKINVFMKFSYLMSLAVGIYFITARPISKTHGKNKKKFETIIGWLLIIISILNFAGELFW